MNFFFALKMTMGFLHAQFILMLRNFSVIFSHSGFCVLVMNDSPHAPKMHIKKSGFFLFNEF
jgi:hypothetical protein